MPARFQVRFVTDRAKASVVIPDDWPESEGHHPTGTAANVQSLMTVREAASYLHVHPQTLYGYIEDGIVEAIYFKNSLSSGRHNKTIRINKSVLDKYLDAGGVDERIRITTPEDALSGKADAEAYVMLEDIADHFGVQTATVKKRATGLGVTLAKVRKPDAKNAYCSAVTAEDARRIGETFLASNLITGAHVLSPDEISKLMEEA